MSNTNSLISSTDVRQFQDVKTVLAETVNNLGSLCQSGKVNKWSKRKPKEYQYQHRNRRLPNYTAFGIL